MSDEEQQATADEANEGAEPQPNAVEQQTGGAFGATSRPPYQTGADVVNVNTGEDADPGVNPNPSPGAGGLVEHVEASRQASADVQGHLRKLESAIGNTAAAGEEGVRHGLSALWDAVRRLDHHTAQSVQQARALPTATPATPAAAPGQPVQGPTSDAHLNLGNGGSPVTGYAGASRTAAQGYVPPAPGVNQVGPGVPAIPQPDANLR